MNNKHLPRDVVIRILELKYLNNNPQITCNACNKPVEDAYYYEFGDDGDAGMLCKYCKEYEIDPKEIIGNQHAEFLFEKLYGRIE